MLLSVKLNLKKSRRLSIASAATFLMTFSLLVSPSSILQPAARATPFTDTAILRLDGSNSSSYSGSGTTWANLKSGTIGNASLINGTAFNSRSNFFNFDGVNDYVSVPTFTADFRQGISAHVVADFGLTHEAWERLLDFGTGEDQVNIFFSRLGTSTDLRVGVHAAGAGNDYSCDTTTGPIIYGPAVYSFTISSDEVCKIYVNHVEVATSVLPGSNLTLPNTTFTSNYIAESNWSADAFFKGTIQSLILYNIVKEIPDCAPQASNFTGNGSNGANEVRYKLLKFSTAGRCNLIIPSSVSSIDALVVGAGGGGGWDSGSGGGGGALIEGSVSTSSTFGSTINVQVGVSGASGNWDPFRWSSTGGTSTLTFNDPSSGSVVVSAAGGIGGSKNDSGSTNTNSGANTGAGAAQPGAPTDSSSALSWSQTQRVAGGTGGAAAPGGYSGTRRAGSSGTGGVTSSIFGGVYGGGGGSGSNGDFSGGSGVNGGGTGSTYDRVFSTAGLVNSGGGGGGGSAHGDGGPRPNSRDGAIGGSGFVQLRYALPKVATPGSFTAATISGARKSINTSWNASENAASYQIQILDGNDSLLSTISVASGTSKVLTTSDYAGLTDDTVFRLKITALGDNTDYINSDISGTQQVRTHPEVTVTITQDYFRKYSRRSIVFTFVFSETVTGFNASDVTLTGTGWSKGTVTGSGTTYELIVTNSNPTVDENVSVSIGVSGVSSSATAVVGPSTSTGGTKSYSRPNQISKWMKFLYGEELEKF